MPEDQAKTITIDYKKCVSCGICTSLCPHKALELVNGYPNLTGSCKVCGLCASSCITNAISMVASKFKDDAILEEVAKSPSISCRRISKDDVRLLCASRIDLIHIAEALAKHGFALISTCGKDCRNLPGAIEVRSKVKAMQIALEKLGLEADRVKLSEGVVAEGSFEKISEKSGEMLRMVAKDRNVRALVAKMRSVAEGNVYGEKVDLEKIEKELSKAIDAAIRAAMVMLSKKNRVSEIAKETGMSKRDVVKTLTDMKRIGFEIHVEDELVIA